MTDRDKAIDRIRKLLALAEGSGATEAEAMLAAERASEMMDRWKVERAQVDGAGASHGRIVCLDVGDQYEQRTWVQHLFANVAKTFDCQGMVQMGGERMSYQFVGDDADALVAAHFFDFLYRSCRKESDMAWFDDRGTTAQLIYDISQRKFTHAFRQGMAVRLGQRMGEMRERRAAHDPTLGALIKSSDVAVSRWLAQHVPEAQDRKTTMNLSDADVALRMGWIEGGNTALNKPIEEGGTERPALTS